MSREEVSKEALQFPDAIRTSDALFWPDLSWVHVATLVVSTVRTVLCVFVCCVRACVLHVCVVRVEQVGGAASVVFSLMCQYLCCLVSLRFVHLCAFHVRVHVCICM
jgi:hypothetical protein